MPRCPCKGDAAERRVRCVFRQAFDRNLGGSAVPTAPGQSYGFEAAPSVGKRLLGAAAALLAPAECRICALPLVCAGLFPVCESCVGDLTASVLAGCSRCGEALAMESVRAAGLSRTDPVLCDDCTQELPPFERAAAFGNYGGALRSLIHLYKFDGVRALRKPLGLRLADAVVRACDGMTGPVLVVAVPLFRGKRAFNQSAELTDVAVRMVNSTPRAFTLETAHGLLKRTRRTDSQAHLSPQQRRTNVHGAFAVQGEVRGAQVLLVDDVYTTGATAMECTRTLLRAGALAVRVATLARTQREMSATWAVAGWDVPEMSV